MFDVTALLTPGAYDHSVGDIELIETHISWVILTGDYAYKIKKPVDFGFLDFSSLARRKHFCEEELRLNRRLAPEIYLEVVTIDVDADACRINGSGTIEEYAVRMRQFDQAAQLDRMLAQDALKPAHLDAFADRIAQFHGSIAVAGTDTHFGDPATVWQPVEENFRQIREHAPAPFESASLDNLADWSRNNYQAILPLLQSRKQAGFIRECHGDLHLRNMAWVDDRPVAFDCIEFNPALRWIDVISEVAFLVMDLHDRAQHALAHRFLNAYLEHTGDYAGIAVLRFYLVYRALVRAKVDALRLSQSNVPAAERQDELQAFYGYLQLAERFVQTATPRIILTHGLSASGKTTITQQLREHTGAIRLRSDVERKRLAGMAAGERGTAQIDSGLYAQDMSWRTYAHLLDLASRIVDAGYSVIVEAAFLQRAQREPFYQRAVEKKLPCIVLDITARPQTLRARIVARTGDASDANLAVLEHQLATTAPLGDDEPARCIRVDTEQPIVMERICAQLQQV